MKLAPLLLGFSFMASLPACTTNQQLAIISWYPVVSTLELRDSPGTAPVGEIVGVAGVISSANRTTGEVILDDVVQCIITVGEEQDESWANLMDGYAKNLGKAAAIRGRLRKSSNSRYPFQLKPSAPSITEVSDVRKKLTAESKRRPPFRFSAYYGWREDIRLTRAHPTP